MSQCDSLFQVSPPMLTMQRYKNSLRILSKISLYGECLGENSQKYKIEQLWNSVYECDSLFQVSQCDSLFQVSPPMLTMQRYKNSLRILSKISLYGECFGENSQTTLIFVNYRLYSGFASVPVDTRRRFSVYKTSIRCRRRRIDVL